MERLTRHSESGCIRVYDTQACIQKLAAYEDTGMDPEEFSNAVHDMSGALMAESILRNYISPERTYKILKAEQEGRLLVLPCKVGDTVYVVENGKIVEQDVIYEMDYGHSSSGNLCMLFSCEMGVYFYGEDIGKTVFLTREEAEAALGKEKNNA